VIGIITGGAAVEALQVTLLVLVAAGATMVIAARSETVQVVVVSVYGLFLALLFLAFQAPDVALSELAVGAIALPALLLATLVKIQKERSRK
jgi:energy-converting hydrogenase B subunit D